MKKKSLILLILPFMLGACTAQEAQAAAVTEQPQPQSTVSPETEAPAVTEQPEEENTVYPEIEAGIDIINKYGNIVLTVSPQSMRDLGYEPADMILVRIGDHEMEMPIGTAYSDVDSGEPVCCWKMSSDNQEHVILAVNSGNMVSALGAAEIRVIDEEPGYECVYAEGLDENSSVFLSMTEKQGYADEYEMHQLSGVRTNNRADYPALSDAEYANFRAVSTTGIGTDTLFRSSSPVNPAYNRAAEADEAMMNGMVRTVINMADSEEMMRSYADYGLTYYSSCDIIALNMGMNPGSEDYRDKLADGFRFIAEHDGPYLIHCNEGKDRTGFAVAVLECLMGADKEEITEDYMLSFYNFYGITKDSDQYMRIAQSNILSSLASAFGLDSLDDADLSACAEEYLTGIGLSKEEIEVLKTRLSADYGAMALN